MNTWKTVRRTIARRRWIGDERGQALVVTALCMFVLIAFLGLAIDVGNLRFAKRKLQAQADAAALAAGLEVRVCGTTPSCPAMLAAAENAMTENGQTNFAVITNCGSTPGSGLTLMVNDPPCALSTDPNKGKTTSVEVEVSRTMTTYFASLVGYNNVPIMARAEAQRGVGGPCIYALDPSGSGAINLGIGVLVQSQCGIVDESTSSSALVCGVGLGITAPSINVAGGVASLLCLGNSPVHTGVKAPTPADPLAYLPAPANANAACGTSTGSPYFGSSKAVNPLLVSNIVFNPGVYCGGISLTATVLSNITFNPGTYILRQGPGLLGITSGGLNLTIAALSNISAQGVTFYNEGPFGGISVTATSPLGALLPLTNTIITAPTSGEYGGVLFYQPSTNTSTGIFLASLISSSKIDGAIYLPNALLTYGVGALASDYNIVVAKDIQFSVNVLTSFGNNYSTLQSGSPLNGDNAVLVQ